MQKLGVIREWIIINYGRGPPKNVLRPPQESAASAFGESAGGGSLLSFF